MRAGKNLKFNPISTMDVLHDFSEAVPQISQALFLRNRTPLIIVDKHNGQVMGTLLEFIEEYRDVFDEFAKPE